MASCFLSQATIGSLHDRLSKRKEMDSTLLLTPPAPSGVAKKGRHVKWHLDPASYELIKQGIPLSSTRAIEQMYQLGEIRDDSHIYIFRHTNFKLMERNQNVPMYEAVYWLSEEERYVKVQKCHLKQMYAAMGKTNTKMAHFVDEMGMPYWVDRFIFSKIKS